ncbi:hypothetical protein KFL_009410020 [Klebsormidium nitens]|uniref:Uncharacterized protein n=1 Tax=Klebsormidium nitens TaxID=105231 RepID=A0A1Y1ITP5_KLENI|nr:hypothetical protein KFL_009410020 [Klebsormidium nitens]|eukprot:GAQ92186.1 hypothetical protein KFL_009410020 [Klebsormidium nitens]
MAGRGRGRGWGRGSGFVIRDDDGNMVLPDKLSGPPPLFPPIENLPEVPEIGDEEEELLNRRRRLESAWLYSPYHIEKPKSKTVGLAAEIERYADRYRRNPHAIRAPLSSVLKLTPKHFPAELLGPEKGKGRGGGAAQATAASAPWKSAPLATTDIQRLERLANLEQKIEANGDKATEKPKEGEGGEEDEEEALDEEDEMGEGDYEQGYQFEDDELYGDDDDAFGNDEGPTF